MKKRESEPKPEKPRKYIHPEGGEAFPVTKEDEKALEAQGWKPEEE